MRTFLHAVTEGPAVDHYRTLFLKTNHGTVETRYYPAPKARAGVLWLGGAGGGFDTPAHGLYPTLCRALQEAQIASLRVQYRTPRNLEGATQDTLAGASLLHQEGIKRLAVVGHSLGGAVAIRAAARNPAIRAVVGLAPQSYGTDEANLLRDRAVLLLHGTADRILPYQCALAIQAKAPHAEVVLLPGAGHVLDEAADDLRARLPAWLKHALIPPEGEVG